MLVIVVLSGGSTAVRSLFCVLFRNEMRGSDELPRPPPAGLLCSAAQVAPALVSGCVPSSALVGRQFQARSPARRPCCQVMLLSAPSKGADGGSAGCLDALQHLSSPCHHAQGHVAFQQLLGKAWELGTSCEPCEGGEGLGGTRGLLPLLLACEQLCRQ